MLGTTKILLKTPARTHIVSSTSYYIELITGDSIDTFEESGRPIILKSPRPKESVSGDPSLRLVTFE